MPRRYRMDARMRAVDTTRSRIVGAAMELHAERGAMATNWNEIGQRAGVSAATVYRHFGSLDELIPACARTVFDVIGVIGVEQVEQVYAGARTPWERLERFIRGTCDCYAKGDGWLHAARREADLIPAMNRAVESQEKSNEVFIKAAFAGYEVDAQTATVVGALIDFPFWKSLVRGGMAHEQAVEVICGLVRNALQTQPWKRRNT